MKNSHCGYNYSNLKVLLTDAASYMIKCGKHLNVFFLQLLAITCLAHALYRVSEKLRDLFQDVKQ